MESRPSTDLTSREELLSRVGSELRSLVYNLEIARERIAKEQKLHSTDLRCLGYLDRVGVPVNAKAIIEEIGLTSGSGTALLDRLENAGYIKRLRHPTDRRSVLIELNVDAAAEVLARYRQIENAYREATTKLGADQLMTVADFLSAMNATTKTMFGN